MNRTRTSLLALAGAVCITGLAMPHAQAASFTGPNGFITNACPGKVIDSGRVGSHPTATWKLWYSSTNGGTNCLKVYDNTGGSHSMAALIRPAGNFHDGAKDSGTFSTYAGGSGIKRVAGKCIGITAVIHDNGRRYERNIDSFHCG